MRFNYGLKIIVSFIILTAIAVIYNQSSAQIEIDSYKTAQSEFEKADRKMNDIYKQIIQEYHNDKIFLKKLKAAQVVWLKFRDAHIDSLFPAEDKRAVYGSTYKMCYYFKLKKITDDRIIQLQEWLDGLEEGDVCAGSIKITPMDESLKKVD